MAFTKPASGPRQLVKLLTSLDLRWCAPGPREEVSSCTCQNRKAEIQARNFKQAKPLASVHLKAMPLPLYLCNPVANNNFTLYIPLDSFQNTFTNCST